MQLTFKINELSPVIVPNIGYYDDLYTINNLAPYRNNNKFQRPKRCGGIL